MRVKRNFRIPKQIIVVIIATLLIFGISYLGYFNITKVSITNEKGKEPLHIASESYVKIKKKIVGESYFNVSADTIGSVLKENPYIHNYWIEKEFPNRVKVVVKERVPSYLVISKEGKCALMDRDAFTLEVIDESEICSGYNESGVVKISANPFPVFTTGNQSSFYYIYNVNNIESVFSRYNYKIQKVNIKDGVCELFISDNQSVVVSFNQVLEVQLARFVVVIDDIRTKSIDFKLLDLRYERPVIRGG